ncbi:homogentisate 1,2-dioxygenase [Robbsia andropogonis]|uniref:Homogentisate 1,2-dioxygenase n=1 Tax=Robbsia andropogonis TaxID=28092 RepID=A0A0F5K5I2_9BURK|nr:homogentisate 1,2-dioxygenase [Robbsia andropogonis]KKB64797.1 homogentisate 1,2-dioxygenase [Robbsia andropogonis]
MTEYLSGFGNTFSSEALAGALPVGRNSPQRCPYGLYAEQLSGTAFTAPRAENRRSWLYRIRPSAMHEPFEKIAAPRIISSFDEVPVSPNQLRWNALPAPATETDFIDGIVTMAGHGSPRSQSGAAVHLYAANQSMWDRVFYNADGEMLVVPQEGVHRFVTEFGIIEATPQEIVVIPRGVRFRLELPEGPVRGYICENYGANLRLPDLGPIGSNGLANPRDFLTPVAAFEDKDTPHQLIAKFMGGMWCAQMKHSPLDVAAWHGNYAPYKYDLRRFNAIGSISFDHPDPSIFLVLHSASDTPGVSNIDFVIFPPRVLAMQDTFRPPWFHRNVASEFMGLVHGAYDGKTGGFAPGGASLHNSMTGHGPDAGTFERASRADLSKPDIITDTMAFMFESRLVWHPTRYAMESAQLQRDYFQCWQGLNKYFEADRS